MKWKYKLISVTQIVVEIKAVYLWIQKVPKNKFTKVRKFCIHIGQRFSRVERFQIASKSENMSEMRYIMWILEVFLFIYLFQLKILHFTHFNFQL